MAFIHEAAPSSPFGGMPGGVVRRVPLGVGARRRTAQLADRQRQRSAGTFRVTESGLVQMRDSTGAWKPIAGDHDIFDIRHLDGSRLTPVEEEALIKAMKDANMGVAHGAHMYWPSSGAKFDPDMFAKIINDHQPGGEPLIRFAPGEEPVVVFAPPP